MKLRNWHGIYILFVNAEPENIAGKKTVLRAECGAAVMVIDIVTRNLEKEEMLSLN